MKNEIIMYLTNNTIHCYIKKEKKYFIWNLSPKILKYGKIVHRPKFQKELAEFFKKEKILKRFHRNIIYFLTPPIFEEVDKEILKLILEDFPINELKFIKENNLYQIRKNIIWINLNNTYAYIFMKTNHHIITMLWHNNQGIKLEELVKNQLSIYPKIKKIILIGTNKDLPIISETLAKNTQKRVLYYEDYDKYLIKTFLRHNLI